MNGRLAASLLVVACAHRPQPAGRRDSRPIVLPRIDSADDIELALDEHAAVPVDHPQRAASRSGLRGWLIADLSANLQRGHPDVAFERLLQTLRLYTAEEMERAQPDADLLAAADRVRAAFSARGGEREVLTALATRLTFLPRDRAALGGYQMLCAWIDEVGDLGEDPSTKGFRLIERHETIVRDLPSPFMRDRLEKLYLGLHDEIGRALRRGLPPQIKGMVEPRRALAQVGHRLVALHLRAGTTHSALAAIRRLRGRLGDDADLRRLLEATAAADASPDDFVSLGRYFAPTDAEVAERACMAGIATLGPHPDLLVCAADYAIKQGLVSLALTRARSAVAARPDSPALREEVARLLGERVERLVGRERIDAAAREVASAEEFLADTRRRLPDLEMDPTPGAFQYQLAQGLYNTGSVARAEELLERSLRDNPSPFAYEDLGVIKWRRGRFVEALELYSQAAMQKVAGMRPALRLAASLRRRIGDTLRDQGDRHGAQGAWRDSLRLWDEYMQLVMQDLDDERMGEVSMAQVEKARLFYSLGENVPARRAIDLAIAAAPERGNTYVQSVALLATHGDEAEATDALHRALGQPTVADYYKIYCSLWILDLGRRSGRPDPLARHYLENVDGDQWHHRLARFMAGLVPYAAMEALADTPGKKAELFFYEAQNRLAAGRVDEARRLWRQVLRTDMMAFFEYDMALHYLATHAPR